jgi:hypothetical protein
VVQGGAPQRLPTGWIWGHTQPPGTREKDKEEKVINNNKRNERQVFGDLVVQKALEQSGAGLLDPQASARVVHDTMTALGKMAATLAEANYSEMRVESVGKSFAYAARVVESLVRLGEFMKGNPDSRTEVLGLESLISVLNDEQLDALTKKMERDYGMSEETQEMIQEGELV